MIRRRTGVGRGPARGLFALAIATLAPRSSLADEGQWMPEQVSDLDQGHLRELGLRLAPEEIYKPGGGGLMDAVVNLSGCSAGFVSAKGLVATNHHCAYSAIQSQSTVEHDYLHDGFVARKMQDELEAKGRSVRVLQSIEDVTERIRATANEHTEPAQRARAVELQSKKIVAECESDPTLRCDVAQFYNGSLYKLFAFMEIEDVRIVYAPPSSVGNFGGEVDNWMWPRHGGDFSLLRAYVGPDGKPAPYSTDNVPYQPERWLQTNPQGVGPGDFVAVLGFPGHTDRYLPAPEVQRRVEQFLPARVDLYGAWIRILEDAGKDDPEVHIKVAATLRSFANRHKNARGMIEGIGAISLVQRRKHEEEQLAAWAAQPENVAYADVLDRLAELTEKRRESFERDFLIDNLARSGNAVAIAIDLVRWAKERQKPDLEREKGYQDRDHKKLWNRIERRLRDYDRGVDEATMAELFGRIAALPAQDRFTKVTAAQLGAKLRGTKVTSEDFAKESFDVASWEAIEASRDPMLVLARELVEAIEANEQADRERRGVMLELGPKYFEMLEAVRKGPVYPDANGTLRLSYATVVGYSPRDGLRATPQTTVEGQVAKHTGQEPFDLPEAVREAAARAGSSYWADPNLGDVPVCFLSNADTTGGNSGSPVVDGQGRWIGLNFDRVWENIAGDFGYHPARSRNITVDVRYLLWMLDEVEDATGLLEELGVAQLRGAPPPKPRRGADAAQAGILDAAQNAGQIGAPTQPPQPPPASATGCGCTLSRTPRPAGIALGWLILALTATRRRRDD